MFEWAQVGFNIPQNLRTSAWNQILTATSSWSPIEMLPRLEPFESDRTCWSFSCFQVWTILNILIYFLCFLMFPVTISQTLLGCLGEFLLQGEIFWSRHSPPRRILMRPQSSSGLETATAFADRTWCFHMLPYDLSFKEFASTLRNPKRSCIARFLLQMQQPTNFASLPSWMGLVSVKE